MGDDRHLVEMVLGGDQGAFEELVKRYQRQVYYLALRMLREEGAAADVTQTTFMKAYEGLKGFRREASFRTWIYRIAINLCKNHLRDQGRRRTEDLWEHDPPSPADPLHDLMELEARKRLFAAWEELPERQRITVMLKVQEGLRYQEIAKVLGCSIGTVKANFHHACNRLRLFLKGDDG